MRTPGKQFTLTGTTTGGKHEVVFTVTDVTKWVNQRPHRRDLGP